MGRREHAAPLAWGLLLSVALLLGLAVYAPASGAPPEFRSAMAVVEDVPVTSAAPVLTSSVTSTATGSSSVRYELLVVCHGTGSVVSYNLLDLDSDGDPADEIGGAPIKLNSGTALTADCAYTFTISVAPGQALNLEFATTTRASFTLEEVR